MKRKKIIKKLKHMRQQVNEAKKTREEMYKMDVTEYAAIMYYVGEGTIIDDVLGMLEKGRK